MMLVEVIVCYISVVFFETQCKLLIAPIVIIVSASDSDIVVAGEKWIMSSIS